ncbi:MAG: DUF58 domain-containing protein [Deltaproteobacteria bacterium]|nr:DUF58 domain-containing protein [Deltaproteobacteria bacterium]
MDLKEERIPTLFSTWMIQVFILVFLFIALLQGHRNLIIFSAVLLGVMAGANLWSRFALSGIECRSQADKRRVFPGEMFHLDVTVENAKFTPIWLQLTVPLTGPLSHDSRQRALVDESGLLWYQSVRFSWNLKAERRGVYPLGPPEIRAGDLLGFFPREPKREKGFEMIVYPRLVPLKPFPLPRRELFGIPGAKSPVQDPIYILGTRDYQQFSPARHIHWKASARRNRLQEKVFEPSEQEKVLLIVEVAQFQEENAVEDFERTLEVVASLAVQLVQRGYAVGFATDGAIHGGGPAVLPLSRRSHHRTAILETLARLRMTKRYEVLNILRNETSLRKDMGCVRFAYRQPPEPLPIDEYFRSKRIPMTTFVCRLAPKSEKGLPVTGQYMDLNQIRVPEIE